MATPDVTMTTPDREESTLFVKEQDEPGDDDDDISLTSTVDEDAGDDNEAGEYNADCILAERPSEHDEGEEGAMQYLVKWEGKPTREPPASPKSAHRGLC